MIKTKIYSDKKKTQFRVTIPKTIVELLDIEPGDEFMLEVDTKEKVICLKLLKPKKE